jgi:hypothetical protein
MAKRWVIGGLAVGVGALALAPETRTWLRRRLGLEPEDRRWFEEEGAELAEHEGDEPLDTRESRFSLRARLAEEGHAEPAPEEPLFPAFEPASAAPSFPAFEEPAAEAAPVEPVEEPAAEEPSFPAFEPASAAPSFPAFEEPAAELAPVEPVEEPAAEEPAPVEEPAAEEPAPEPPPAPAFEPPAPAREYAWYESVPAVNPEDEAPKTPGEDTNEIEPLPPENAPEPPAAEAPLPPPTLLRPPAPPPPSRPFSGEGASFRSAIDAARERVHGAAREATPDEDEGSEPIDERP